MALPESVRVKLLSEAAGYVTSTRVMQRDFAIQELMEALVAVAGKNIERIQQLLRTGSVVAGDYRYRWAGLEAAREDLEPLLAPFPDPWPERVFEPGRCVYAIIRAGVETIELPREQAARVRRQRGRAMEREGGSFWDALLELARERPPRYESYSYRQRADVYSLEPAGAEVERLREAAASLAMERAAERVQRLPLDKITFLVNR